MRKASLFAPAVRFAIGAALGGSLACGAPAQSRAAPAPPRIVTTSADAAADLPAPTGALATPGAEASPCTSDAMCLNHRCNLAFGKCAFPCETDADCARGTRCFKAVISTCQAPAFGAAAAGTGR